MINIRKILKWIGLRMRRKIKYIGVLNGYFETGCEGMMWALLKDGDEGCESFVFIKAGDYLTIFNQDGTVMYEGEIIPDYKTGWQEFPLNPGFGQPAALDCWIHWTQKGWNPDDWASLFIRKKQEPYLRAELIRKIKK